MALTAAALKLDADARAAALLFAVCHKDNSMAEKLAKRYSPMLCELVQGLQQLNGLRVLTRVNAQGMQMQSEILRKMMLGMVQDVRVVLLNQGESASDIQAYLQQQGLALEDVLLDPGSQAMAQTGTRGLPSTFFYDANGRLRAAHLGELTDASLTDAIGKHFQQKPTPPGTPVDH